MKVTLTLVLLALVACLFTVMMPIWALSEGSWTSRTPVPAGTEYGAAVVNGKIYLIGGYSTQGGYLYSNMTQVYDPESDTWTTLAPMPTPRANFGITVYNNRIYVIGGENTLYGVRGPNFIDFTAYGVTGVNEVYDPATNTWETKAPMPTPRSQLHANTVDGKIYLIGGLAQQRIEYPLTEHSSNVTETYDPQTNTWTTNSPIPTPVWSYASTTVDNKIFVISGRTGSSLFAFGIGSSLSNQVQIFDPRINSWTVGENIPMPVTLAAAVATPENIAPKQVYVLGGCPVADTQAQKGTNANQIYDPVANVWSSGPKMPTSRYGLVAAIVNDKLYALGGGSISIINANEQYFPIGYLSPHTSPESSTALLSPTTQQQPASSSVTPIANNSNINFYWIVTTIIVVFISVAITIIIKKKPY